MSERFKNILTLALRPETGTGEAEAALHAARRMVAKEGLEGLMPQGRTQIQERVVYKDKIVYKDRVVYRDSNPAPRKTYDQPLYRGTARVQPHLLAEFLAIAFDYAKNRNIAVVIGNITQDPQSSPARLLIVWEAYGTKEDLLSWYEIVESRMKKLAVKPQEPQVSPRKAAEHRQANKKRGFWARLFGK